MNIFCKIWVWFVVSNIELLIKMIWLDCFLRFKDVDIYNYNVDYWWNYLYIFNLYNVCKVIYF